MDNACAVSTWQQPPKGQDVGIRHKLDDESTGRKSNMHSNPIRGKGGTEKIGCCWRKGRKEKRKRQARTRCNYE